MKALGLDIGTTTLCLTVIDAKAGSCIDSTTVPNDSFIAGRDFERLQDPSVILRKVFELVNTAAVKYNDIVSLGVTGQMHGIVYLDANGEAAGPLAIWQDERGNERIGDETYAQTLSRLTGYAIATGFGSVTHYYNTLNHQIPANASTFCTIHDYAAMKLAGVTKPFLNVTDAASFGLFDLAAGQFDINAIEAAGMNPAMFPQVTSGATKLGRTEHGIPVFAAIGDNQASFIGSVREPQKSVLVNVGTGSQISFYEPIGAAGIPSASSAMETRPMPIAGHLKVGAALCGGRAYAALEGFFRQVVTLAGYEPKRLYAAMDTLAAQAPAQPLDISTAFCGSRENPALRGSIANLGLENFTPAHFIYGVLEGSVNELLDMYNAGQANKSKHKILVASGNGIRRGLPLQKIFAEKFGMRLQIPAHEEEAAYGAALFGLVGAGVYASLEEAQALIKYRE